MNAFAYMTISLNFQGVCLVHLVGWLVSLFVCLFFIRPQKYSLQFYALQFTTVPNRNVVQLV